MDINTSTSILSQEIGKNKAQTGLDVLTRTLTKTEKTEPVASEQGEALRVDLARQTGKGQNIDIKV